MQPHSIVDRHLLALSIIEQAAVRITVTPGKTYHLVPAAWGPGVQGIVFCGGKILVPSTHTDALAIV